MREEVSQITYGDLFAIVRGSWKLIFLLICVGGVAGLLIVYTVTPVYRAVSLLAPSSDSGSGGSSLAKLAEQFVPLAGITDGIGGSRFGGKDVWIATLRSRRLTEGLIKDLDLLPVLIPDGQSRFFGLLGNRAAPTLADGFKYFNEEVRSISEDRRTGLVTLTIDWSDPKAAAEWANALVERANELIRSRTIEETTRSIEYLDSELKRTLAVERRQIIYGLIESMTNQVMMANSRKEFAFIVVDPAVAPEQHDFLYPRRTLYVGTGMLLGMTIGFLIGCVRWVRAGALVEESR